MSGGNTGAGMSGSSVEGGSSGPGGSGTPKKSDSGGKGGKNPLRLPPERFSQIESLVKGYHNSVMAPLIEEQGGRGVSIGAVYTTLSRLEEKGYVSSRVGEPTATRGGRAKRFFKIAASGTRALERSVRTLNRMVDGLVAGWKAI